MNILSSVKGKQRWMFKRALKEKESYTFHTLSYPEFKTLYNLFIKAHTDYFLSRGKKSIWENCDELLLELLGYFDKEENLFIRLIRQNDNMAGIYIHVYILLRIQLLYLLYSDSVECT